VLVAAALVRLLSTLTTLCIVVLGAATLSLVIVIVGTAVVTSVVAVPQQSSSVAVPVVGSGVASASVSQQSRLPVSVGVGAVRSGCKVSGPSNPITLVVSAGCVVSTLVLIGRGLPETMVGNGKLDDWVIRGNTLWIVVIAPRIGELAERSPSA
jgi:hypothetical protein